MNSKIIVTGVNGSLSKAVTNWLMSKHSCDVIQISLRDNSWKEHSFCGIQSIVHIAGITPQNAKSEKDYKKVNVTLTQELAEKAKKDGVRQFIYISSMSVYGIIQQINAKKGKVVENTACIPDSEYGKSKLKAEKALAKIASKDFKPCIIRVPGIYGKEKTEYLDQYKYLAEKLPFIPRAFKNNYKSAIYIDNLCELIYLAIEDEHSGIICPDDGLFTASDFCSAIYPSKKKSRLLGLFLEIFMKNNSRIVDYYGAIYYSEKLSNVFDGRYRVVVPPESVMNSYK